VRFVGKIFSGIPHEITRNYTKGVGLKEEESGLVYPEESFAIIGACFEVYKTMGHGFLEGVYQECLEIEFANRRIAFEAQKEIDLQYKGQILKQKYKADFVCHGKIIVEIKALAQLQKDHEAQTLNYLNGTQFRLGILVNFGRAGGLESKRLVL
jgi:GxxExxY protein